MSDEPPIVKTEEDARQGQRVKGMTTVLVVSVIATALIMLVIVVVNAS